MSENNSENRASDNSLEQAQDIYECECTEEKKFRVTYDGGSSGQYAIEFCQICFDQDDRQFMISQERLFAYKKGVANSF